MAKYKNREVVVVQEMPGTEDQVLIEHLELQGQREIVPKTSVVMTREERDGWQKTEEARLEDIRKNHRVDNDFRVEGETDEFATPAPTVNQVLVQRRAEDNIIRAEEQRKEQEEWQKAHPNAPAGAFRELDAIKVVPLKEETEQAFTSRQATVAKQDQKAANAEASRMSKKP